MHYGHNMSNIVIIGSGVGGLASAVLLAKDGHHVTVIEKNEQPGGRAGILDRDGFRFDMGPSWYLMPEVFERFYQSVGTSTAEQLKLHHLSPHYRMFFPDGSHVDITGDLERDKQTFEQIEPGSAQAFDRYLEQSKRKYDVSLDTILYRNIRGISDFYNEEFRSRMMAAGKELDVFESMDHYVRRFFKTEKMQQIIQYTLIFLGGMPQNTPALYSLMSHIDFNLGVWYPQGGIHAIIESLVRLGQQHGVEYAYDRPVTNIETRNGQAVAVHCSAGDSIESYPCDLVLSNADYRHTESLIDRKRLRQYPDLYWNTRSLAPSAFILYLGVRGKIQELVHHNLIFSQNWGGAFKELTTKPTWPRDPSLYICVPSKTDPAVAPDGDENLFVLLPIAPGLYETKDSREAYGNFILDYIQKYLGTHFADRIVVRETFSVSDFAARYNAQKGTALGLAHTMLQTSVFRPPNRSRRIGNLYFVGANTTPGIGVPMCLISAHLVHDQISVSVQG